MKMCSEVQLVLFVLTLFGSGFGQDFGYDGNIGPKYWGQKFEKCVGKHQSPIDIEEHDVEMVTLPGLRFENFDEVPDFYELENNGHTVSISLNTTYQPIISGGPLVGMYKLSSFHFHWGSNDEEGSETKINNSSFPMELHMVFYRFAYGSFKDALDHPDGLVVLSFLYSCSDRINENYVRLLETLPQVQKPQTSAILKRPPSIQQLIVPDLSRYYTYSGSLTTPPCSEVVTWIDFTSTIPLFHEQIDVFRHLYSTHGLISHNFRPVQQLNGRIIRMNEPDNYYKNDYENDNLKDFGVSSKFEIKLIILGCGILSVIY